MKRDIFTIDCATEYKNSCRTAPFTVVRYTLNYNLEEDRSVIDSIIKEAELLSKRVNTGRANNSTNVRVVTTIRANCYAGVFSEYFWKLFLNENGNDVVKTTHFSEAATQIDLEVVKNGKKIEVRSSFPRNGISFAICHPKYEFDILGPYHNAYKPAEIQKDFYVRTFFELKFPSEIIQKVKSDLFEIYLVGGATWDMMWDNQISKNKDLVPEDSFSVQEKTTYRVVPLSKALDTIEMKNLIEQ